MDDKTYYAKARDVMQSVCRQLDDLELDDVDADITGGGLIIEFSSGRKLILSQQTPVHQLWLASPGGGYHFEYRGDRWLDDRDGVELHQRLSALLTEHAGTPIAITPGA